MHARAGRVAVPERREHADGEILRREDVDERDADLHGRAVALAGDVHEAAERLHDEVVAGAARAAGRAEARDRGGDDAGVELAHRLVADAEAVERARQEVVDGDVGVSDKPAHDAQVVLVREIQRNRLFIAVRRLEVRSRAVLGVGRPPGAGVVARARALHLDHLGAEVGERHRGHRARKNPRKIKHAQAREGPGRLLWCRHVAPRGRASLRAIPRVIVGR